MATSSCNFLIQTPDSSETLWVLALCTCFGQLQHFKKKGEKGFTLFARKAHLSNFRDDDTPIAFWINESKYIVSYQFISSRYLYSSAMISLLFKPSTALHWRLGWIDRQAKAIAQTHRCPETRPFGHKWHVEIKPRASLKIIDNSWKETETCLCTKLILLRVQILSIISVATKVLVQVCCLEEAFHAVLISLMMDLSNTWNWLEKRALPWTIPGSLHFGGFLAMGCRDAGNPQVWMYFYGKKHWKKLFYHHVWNMPKLLDHTSNVQKPLWHSNILIGL